MFYRVIVCDSMDPKGEGLGWACVWLNHLLILWFCVKTCKKLPDIECTKFLRH